MKPIFKRLLSGMLSAVMTISAIPLVSAYADEGAKPYPYTMFAASSDEGAITVNAGNFCVNGNVATNGTIVSSGNMNINGTRTEHADESMLYVLKKLNYSYFSGENVETYTEDYVLEDLNININNPIDVDGTIELTGNINLNSGIKAVDDVTINGEVKNSNNAIICSETGDINIETSNVSFNGLIYAPYGDIVIDSDNLNLNNVVIIGQTITIDCPNVNANYSSSMAELIGNESDIDVELYAMGSYNADVNAIDIEWFTNYINSSYEVLYSDDNENYTSIATVTDATTYQYLITEDFQKRYFKISLVTNYGEEIESIPFVATKIENGYEVDFLDSDEDGLSDIYEIVVGTDVNLPDTDGDTLTDYQEIYITGTDPTIYDSVVAGVSDADADSDGDGLSNSVEITMGTNPQKADTDDDGLSDYDEINLHNTNPIMPDSDNDNIEDGSEIKLGLDPNNPETFSIPDSEFKVLQSISTDSSIFSSINTEESPYELSIELKTNLDAEKKLSVVQSGYSISIQNDAMIGASLDISISDECNPEDIIIRYNIKEGYQANTLNLYSEFEELSGLKRLNIFKFDEETRMLLPIDTQFDVENGTLFAEVDELGTYCIMDMEIWLNNLGVTLSIPEVNDTYSNSSPKYSPKKAPPKTNPSWTPTYINAPIDLVFILQSAGTSSSNFNTEKSVISNFAQTIFNEYEDVRVYIIKFNKDEADFCKPSYLLDSNIQYLTQYSDVISALKTITYTSEYNYCDRGQAFQKLFTNVDLRENADKFIYQFVNGKTKSYTNYDQTSVLNSNLGAYSEIFPSGWYYEDASFGNNIKNRITKRGDLFITLDDDTYSDMIKHLEGKISPERVVYEILLPTSWKTVLLEGEISPDSDVDTDKDTLTDWEEVDTERLVWYDDGSFDIPTFNIATVVLQMQRFNSDFSEEYFSSSTTHYYLPIISDPTLKDSDDDKILDPSDFSPLITLTDDEKTIIEFFDTAEDFEIKFILENPWLKELGVLKGIKCVEICRNYYGRSDVDGFINDMIEAGILADDKYMTVEAGKLLQCEYENYSKGTSFAEIEMKAYLQWSSTVREAAYIWLFGTAELLCREMNTWYLREPSVVEEECIGRYAEYVEESVGNNNNNRTVPSQQKGSKPFGTKAEGKGNGIKAQNESADLLANNGYKVEMLEEKAQGNGYGINPLSNPDYLIENRAFDCYSPETDKSAAIIRTIGKKTRNQAERIVLNLSYSGVTDYDELITQIISKTTETGELKHLQELLVIYDGKIIEVFVR